MKKEIIDVDKARGVFRVTTQDERWYIRPSKNKTTGLPEYEYVPSVTFITSLYPKTSSLTKWIAEQGWDEAEAMKKAAGERGSRIHLAIADLVNGKEILPNAQYLGVELSVDEYWSIISFRDWFETVRPEVLGSEFVIWNEEHGYAGTVDLKLRINGEVWVVDIKSSQNVWPEFSLQLSAYRHAIPECKRTGVIQVGYRRGKSGFKFTETFDNFDVFLATKRIWASETEGRKPLQREYPLSVKLNFENTKSK